MLRYNYNYKGEEIISMTIETDDIIGGTPSDFERFITDLFGTNGEYCYINNIKFITLDEHPDLMMGIAPIDFCDIKYGGIARLGIFPREEVIGLYEFASGNYPRA